MDWSASTVWWLAAGVLVAAELATGTFYLLMLALGCVAVPICPVNLDVGGTVQVPAWDADGSARIAYRGSHWEARHVGTGHPVPGLHVIRAVEGNHLLLERAPH